MPPETAQPLIILIPVFNDWEAVEIMLRDLDAALEAKRISAEVILADDGSPAPCPNGFLNSVPRSALHRVRVLNVRRNLSHQRALAIGLAYIHANVPHRAVVVMDGDGEDVPADVPRLLERLDEYERRGESRVVFAERAKRSEGLTFRVSYEVYRRLHRLLIGSHVRVGNFSVIPAMLLHRLVVAGELWSHYAAAIIRLRLPFDMVPCVRGKRTFGQSKMNFVSLSVHGLTAISVNSDIVGMRLILFSLAAGVLALLALLVAAVLVLGAGLRVPAWVILSASLGLLVAGQALAASVLFVLITLRARPNTTFVPERDFPPYVLAVRDVRPD